MDERQQARASHQLDAVFGALSHPDRRMMIERLASGRSTVTQIADHFPASLNTVSRHLKVLERAGLIERSVEGREHHLSLNLAHLMEAMQWSARQADFWHRRLDALEMAMAKRKKGPHGPTD